MKIQHDKKNRTLLAHGSFIVVALASLVCFLIFPEVVFHNEQVLLDFIGL